jgi:hypothetical protein
MGPEIREGMPVYKENFFIPGIILTVTCSFLVEGGKEGLLQTLPSHMYYY